MLRPKLMVYINRSQFADETSTSKQRDGGQWDIRYDSRALARGGAMTRGNYVF
jgi:hypothetical protein